MKAIEVAAFGGPDELKLVEKPRPEPGPGQLLIEVKAAGINFADLLAREGKYPPARNRRSHPAWRPRVSSRPSGKV